MAKKHPAAGSPACRIVTVHTFRGDRTPAFRDRFDELLDNDRKGRKPALTVLDCLLKAGHTGVSTDEERGVIYGFTPDTGATSMSDAMDELDAGGSYPGHVLDDTPVFAAAQQSGLTVLRFDVALSPASFATFIKTLSTERDKGSRFRYGFPDGDGDCNCTTWIERMGLPLLTGRMNEFTTVMFVAAPTRRRFGVCI